MRKVLSVLFIMILIVSPVDTRADSYTYGNFAVGRYLELKFAQQYSLVFQMRRAIRLGMQWGHKRAARKGVLLTVGDEDAGAGCLLHLTTGTIMDKIEAMAKERPQFKETGLFQAVAIFTLMECESYGDSLQEFNLN